MRNLNTFVCAGLIAISVCCGAMAQAASPQDGVLHPVLGKRPPRELLNADLLALPERERQAWIHGAMAQMAQTLAGREDKSASKCVMEWYFEIGNGPEFIPKTMKLHPNERATSTIMAVTRLACPKA